MKFLCTKENLNKGVSVLASTPTQDATLPVLSNILLECKEGRLKLAATDLEIGVSCFVSGKVEKEGSLTVPAKLLSQYVGSVTDDKLELASEDSVLSISSANSSTTLTGISADEFPLIPEIKDGAEFELDSKLLAEAVQKTAFAAATDFSRPEISGVYFAVEGEQLILASTDSYRLAEFRAKIKSTSKKKIGVIVPAKTMRSLERILAENNNSVKVVVTENQIMFVIDDTIVTSRLVDGKFPDYVQIIPSSSSTSVSIEKPMLIDTIKTTSLFTKEGVSALKIFASKEKSSLSLSASTSNVGKSESTLPCKVEGEDSEVTFNFRYLLEGLSVINESDVELGLSGNSAPGMIKGKGDKSYIYIVMPLKQ